MIDYLAIYRDDKMDNYEPKYKKCSHSEHFHILINSIYITYIVP